MRVVLDANVLISGLFFSGPPSKILKAWRRGEIQLVFSPEIIDEYARVGRIIGAGFPEVDIVSILTLIFTNSETIRAVPLSHQICEDPDDDKFIACALTAQTGIIISGDKHLLKVSCAGIKVVTPRAFVDEYLKSQSV